MAATAIRKTLRYSLIVLAVLIVGLLVAPFFIDINDYKTRIEQQVEDATGRALKIGEIQASLFPWVGLRLDDVHLANRPGFSERDFLSVRRLHVKLALLPLLHREVEIKQFSIDAPKLYLERNAQGQGNWEDLAGSGQPQASPQAPAGKQPVEAAGEASRDAPMLAALNAESLRLSGGEIVWADAGARPLKLDDIELALDDVQLSRPISLSFSARVAGNPLQLTAQLGPLGDLSRLDVSRLPLRGELHVGKVRLAAFADYLAAWPEALGGLDAASAEVETRFEQRPNGLRLLEGDALLDAAHDLALNFRLESPKVERVEVRRGSLIVDGRELMQLKGTLNHLTTRPDFQLRLSAEPIERTWLAGLVPELGAMYAAHPAPWKKIGMGALLSGNARHLDIRDLQLRLDDELLQVSGNIAYARPDIRLRLASRSLHLDAWLPQAKQSRKGAPESGQAAPAAKADNAGRKAKASEPDLRFLKPWRVTARVQADLLSVHGLDMRDFRVNISGSEGLFHLNPMRFKLAGGSVTEKASLNAAVYPARWTESVHAAGVNLGPVLKSLLDLDLLEGTLDMDTDFRAQGLSDAAVKTLNGRGNVLLRNGKIRGFDIAGTLRRITHPGSPVGPLETDFAQLSGSFRVRNGVASNEDLFMASPLLRVTGHGQVDLVKKQLDYHVKPRVVGTLTGQGDTVKLRKGLSVPLHISGPFAAPKVRPEVDASTLIENAPALLQNKGGVKGALGSVLGGGKPPAGTSPGTKPAAPAPEKKIQDAIGGLLKGL